MAKNEKKKVSSTLGSWVKRLFKGGSRELSEDEKFAVEKIESPSVMAVKAFFRRPLAVIALVVLISLFLLVFIGPMYIPMDLTYTDALQANIAPVWNMRDVPDGLKDNVRTISGFGNFTVGVSQENDFYIWGSTTDNLTGEDYGAIPDSIQDGNVLTAASGSDHIIAITTDGKIVGWGNDNLGQYGYVKNEADPYLQMPEEFITGTIDPDSVDFLDCGYQATALVLDGKLYVWGNTKALLNMVDIHNNEDFQQGVKAVAMSNYYAVVLMEDGSVSTGGATYTLNRQTGYSSVEGKVKNTSAHLRQKKVVQMAATDNCFAFLTEDGEIVVTGAAKYGETNVPTLPEGEKFVQLVAGTKHFLALSDKGTVYGWGHDDSGQLDVAGSTASTIYAGAKQSYLVDEGGEVTETSGLQGYFFGTDRQGRDVLTRIIHGGKMTMTIGAVAVIVSTIIAIIVGCISGYFGGWVDMILMRVTEIFSAIPFLPFAMMLSYVIKTMPIDETTRIFIIMVILGLLSWTGLARMIRAQVLAEREKEFVTAAKSMGVKEGRIAFKHILPNVISVILVSVTLDFAGCLLTESSLSYLGFGVQQPTPTWGNMLNGANNSIVIQNYWWQWVFPAIFLAIATISINIIGDTLRDVLDPKSSQEK
ncbi:MAG: ABC transporter permease subunit [Oscillospiraceae bacterium]|nr:ABC transporter permease subunit [Oscillospiraceae bacterium]